MSTIAVLALQGAFAEHTAMLHKLGAETFEVRQLRDLHHPMDALIIPGGESTVIAKLLRDLGLFDPLSSMLHDGLPVMGTCAGLILLAKTVVNSSEDPNTITSSVALSANATTNRALSTSVLPAPTPVGFATMDIVARRNAYGRQLGSFAATADFAGLGPIPMTFIRAPYIESAGPSVHILAHTGGHIVAARQAHQLVTSFHPELTDDTTVHTYFLDMVAMTNRGQCLTRQ